MKAESVMEASVQDQHLRKGRKNKRAWGKLGYNSLLKASAETTWNRESRRTVWNHPALW